jgi:mannose-6-phosphate isomerase
LRSLITEYGDGLIGTAPVPPTGDFPLLVKYLDARDHLSIQVHPNAEYVERNPATRLKTESWYVVAAEPEASLYLGFKEGVSAEIAEDAVGTPGFVGLLRQIPAISGAFIHVPAGTVHALGAGVAVAEIQTPSDTTFRMYDWAEEYSRPEREMHIEAGMAAIDLDQRPELLEPMTGSGSRTLTDNEFYWLREIRGSEPVSFLTAVGARVLLVVSGGCLIEWKDGKGFEVGSGSTMILPAAVVADVVVHPLGEVTLLEVGLPASGFPS